MSVGEINKPKTTTVSYSDFLGKFDGSIGTSIDKTPEQVSELLSGNVPKSTAPKPAAGSVMQSSATLSDKEVKKIISMSEETFRKTLPKGAVKDAVKDIQPENLKKAADGAVKAGEKLSRFKKIGMKGELIVLIKKCAEKMKKPSFWIRYGTIMAIVIGLKYLIDKKLQNCDDEYENSLFSTSVAGLLVNLGPSKIKTPEQKFDWDKDGKLDEDERTALELYKKSMARQAEEKEKAELLKRFDVNKDGKIDDIEKASMEAYHAQQKKIDDELEKQFDFDKNGELSTKEKAALEAYKVTLRNNAGKEE